MKTALVLGGTRFFGKNLVQTLLSKGVKVTLATRGKTPDDFGDRVERIFLDRVEKDSVIETTRGRKWDVIFDQICYSSHGAAVAVEAFRHSTSHYVLTSTLSVYGSLEKTCYEEDFDPYKYPISYTRRENISYQEGKRQAEAVFFQKAPFSVTAVRFPIVMGKDDYTDRLRFHVEKIMHEEEIGVPAIEAEMNFISQEEAGEFLVWCAEQKLKGPINACSNGAISLKNLFSYIEQAANKTAKTTSRLTDENSSPYGVDHSWTMSNEKASFWGYSFANLQDWLPSLIKAFVESEKKVPLS
ncbi:NAD-dependent epimerase/dehydratase family protein [Priestia megaterium]|uniref:NAD-dependent epimerase/dehydratase family protein n=1 Tax=Priestia megaterium TaxID=1404 RepID=UPI0028560962|nr:NAD-dependent epimerase/dehydratase family protein [Priestia megaterium]MDR7242091.1 nucleoside-diphosphate-sugar epimerase [Priestia megaterium]